MLKKWNKSKVNMEGNKLVKHQSRYLATNHLACQHLHTLEFLPRLKCNDHGHVVADLLWAHMLPANLDVNKFITASKKGLFNSNFIRSFLHNTGSIDYCHTENVMICNAKPHFIFPYPALHFVSQWKGPQRMEYSARKLALKEVSNCIISHL